MVKKLFSSKKSITNNRTLQSVLIVIVIACLLTPRNLHAQSATVDTTKAMAPLIQQVAAKTTYPKTIGYLSFIIPVVTFNKNATTFNFNGTTSIGFPVGVNVLYSDRFGFSYEFTPTIKSTGGANGTSKVSNVLFDPGTMFRFDHGFTIITRLAFETSGRYGFTPVFNQVYARSKYVNYFVALSLPARFGNSEVPSLGMNVQFGFTFN